MMVASRSEPVLAPSDLRPGTGGEAWTERAVEPDDSFDTVGYLRLRDRGLLGPAEVLYDPVRLRRYGENDLDLLEGWLAGRHVYAPLGFPRPVDRAFIVRSAVPDRTGTAEPVEYLLIEDSSTRRRIGFVVCYEARRPDDPDQEVDFALPVEGFGTCQCMRAIRTAVLTYLFCLCGARTVSWVRMRRGGPDEPAADSGPYAQRGAPHQVTIGDFRRALRRISRTRSRSRWPRLRHPREGGTPWSHRSRGAEP